MIKGTSLLRVALSPPSIRKDHFDANNLPDMNRGVIVEASTNVCDGNAATSGAGLVVHLDNNTTMAVLIDGSGISSLFSGSEVAPTTTLLDSQNRSVGCQTDLRVVVRQVGLPRCCA